MLVISYHQKVTTACLPPGEVEKHESIQTYNGITVVTDNLQKRVKYVSAKNLHKEFVVELRGMTYFMTSA